MKSIEVQVNEISLLVQGDVSITLLKESLEYFIGHGLIKADVEWELYKTSVLGFHISLFDADDFEDDNGILFSQYPFMIDIRLGTVATGELYQTELYRVFCLVMAEYLVNKVQCTCLVVKDFREVIAEFHRKPYP